ncbi:hypothetical protein R3W88_030565 [Solanum pinnatisectum]|uniref:Uncharacterized protein n=1 Tax=Solanum pinnatisectum TaxID=50273 RepID=A0AAV9LJG5_9SOLN|nr:hypothetical protein R3W88_030565 [Solanum pinnatisectum]
MDLDDSGVMEARVQFVKSRIQPVIEDMKLKFCIQPVTEDADNEIKHLELLIAIMNGKMKLLTAHRKVFHIQIKIDDNDNDDDIDDNGDGEDGEDDEDKKQSRRLYCMVYVLNKTRKLLRLTTSTPEVMVEHLEGEKEYNIS